MPAHAHAQATLNVDAWSARLLAALEEGEVLVVCRTSASQREVLRRLASAATGGRQGWAGLHVSSLAGYVASLLPQKLVHEAEDAAQSLPDAHPWAGLLSQRPGLRAELGEVVEQAREAEAAGLDIASLRPELWSLARSDWHRSGRAEALATLLQGPRPQLKVFSLGYAGRVSPLDAALLRWLDAHPLETSTPDVTLARLDAVEAPDVVAEAREVVRRAKDASGQVLVLVADVATQERLRAALERNGLPVADDGASPLHRHSLAAALEPLLPVFVDPGHALIEAMDLERLLTEPVLSRRPPKGVELEAIDGLDKLRASVRHVRDLVLGCRRARGTLAQWQQALEAAEAAAFEKWRDAEENKESHARRLASARVVVAQVKMLARHASRAGTLENVADFLEAIDLADWQDRLGRAVVRTLQNEHASPAEARAFNEALQRTVSSGRIDHGVQVLSYGAYDGREASLVVLTGVHSKGLVASPAPGALLREEDLVTLGLPTAREVVEERLALARWAVSRARAAIAIVTRTDASGRAVTAPIDLPLEYVGQPCAPYGLLHDLPDMRDAGAFVENEAPTPESAQVDAEWARSGARFVDTPRWEVGDEPVTLLDHLGGTDTHFPARLAPWLGESGARPDGADALPDGSRLSPSKMEAFTQCLYRAYLQQVLRVEEREEPIDDLDQREVGTAVHGALESLQGVKLLTPETRLQTVRAKVLAGLTGKTAEQMEQIVAQRPGGTSSEALTVARQSLARRWDAHLGGYLQQRIVSPEEGAAARRKSALKHLKSEPAAQAFLAAFEGVLAAGPFKDLKGNVFRALEASEGERSAFLASEELTKKLSGKATTQVHGVLKEAPALLEALCARTRELLAHVDFNDDGDIEVVESEKAVGNREEPIVVPLGASTVRLSGRIDAIARRRGAGGDLEEHTVIDFKTGRMPPKPADLVESLLKPQLAVYALALEAGTPPVSVEALEIDQVTTSTQVNATFGEPEKAHARSTLGDLLAMARRGRFPLVPHPRGCPHLTAGYCDYAEICRLRPGASLEPEREED